MLNSMKGGRPSAAHKMYTRDNNHTKSVLFAVLSDTHIGHSKFSESLFEEFAASVDDVDFILHPGDHIEGMSGRGGHIYELAKVGVTAQVKHAAALYNSITKPIYGIAGNHDCWAKEKTDQGTQIGDMLSDKVPHYTHLGDWEADFHLDNLWIKLFHANDGSAYSYSYKGQKLIESLSVGEKPHIILSGHYHKSLYMFGRGVHHFECGTFCGQTGWMRGKKLAAHMGFWKIRVDWNKSGVCRIAPEWTPWFE